VSNETRCEIVFFRQWVGDLYLPALDAGIDLEQAKARAQVQLELLGQHRKGTNRPRRAWVIERETHTVWADYRLTDNGPVDLCPPSSPRGAESGLGKFPRPRLVYEAGPAGPSVRAVTAHQTSRANGRT